MEFREAKLPERFASRTARRLDVLRTDPFMERLRARYAGTSDGFPAAVPSSHVWEYPLPALEPGLHVVKVRARDEFGQVSRAALSFEVAP